MTGVELYLRWAPIVLALVAGIATLIGVRILRKYSPEKLAEPAKPSASTIITMTVVGADDVLPGFRFISKDRGSFGLHPRKPAETP